MTGFAGMLNYQLGCHEENTHHVETVTELYARWPQVAAMVQDRYKLRHPDIDIRAIAGTKPMAIRSEKEEREHKEINKYLVAGLLSGECLDKAPNYPKMINRPTVQLKKGDSNHEWLYQC